MGARERGLELWANAAVVRSGVNADALRGWVKQADVDAGRPAGTNIDDAKPIKDLKEESRNSARQRSCWLPPAA